MAAADGSHGILTAVSVSAVKFVGVRSIIGIGSHRGLGVVAKFDSVPATPPQVIVSEISTRRSFVATPHIEFLARERQLSADKNHCEAQYDAREDQRQRDECFVHGFPFKPWRMPADQ